MVPTTIKISEELQPKINQIISDFGFSSQEEFIQGAIKDKILELQKKAFVQGSDKIAKKLNEKGITEKEILEDFNTKKHS